MAHHAARICRGEYGEKTMKRTLIGALLLFSTLASADTLQVIIYDSFGSGNTLSIEGRVIEEKNRGQAVKNNSWFSNLWRNVNFLRNSDKKNIDLAITVDGNQLTATSGEDGYFRIDTSPAKPLAPGLHMVKATGKRAAGQGRTLAVPLTNTHGVISDIDDTVIVSEVNDKKKLLENTFLQNPAQRQTFPGTARFYKQLLAPNSQQSATPMIYLSASPRQLTENITAFLAHNDFPTGALITKLVNGDDRDPLLDQQKYKLAKIESVFAALPWVNFELVGDDGEYDPEIYRTIAEKFPQRVRAIYIRRVNPDSTRVKHPGQLDLGAAIGAQ
jgi:phosphatidate phosphatase APP1